MTTSPVPTVRLTTAQATVRFLVNQYSERDGHEQRLIAGAFGIFGHGNVAGLGQALLLNELDPEPDGVGRPGADTDRSPAEHEARGCLCATGGGRAPDGERFLGRVGHRWPCVAYALVLISPRHPEELLTHHW